MGHKVGQGVRETESKIDRELERQIDRESEGQEESEKRDGYQFKKEVSQIPALNVQMSHPDGSTPNTALLMGRGIFNELTSQPLLSLPYSFSYPEGI